MNARHRKTLAAIRAKRTSPIEWRRLESLFKALGAKVIEGRGSRVRFELNGVVATFHRPHPAKDAQNYQIRDARDFLDRAGVKP